MVGRNSSMIEDGFQVVVVPDHLWLSEAQVRDLDHHLDRPQRVDFVWAVEAYRFVREAVALMI